MKMEIKYKISARIMSVCALGIVMLSTSCLMFVCDPLQLIIKKFLQLSDGNIFFNLWSAPPYEIFLKVYAFNITNPDKFLKGEEKMNVSEMGPYTYREILTNENATFFEDGSVTYNPHREFEFVPERSVGDPKDTYMLTTNIPLVGIQAFLADRGFLTNLGFSTLARTMGAQPIINISLHDYLWGYEDKLVKVANQFIPSWIDFGRFGILERMLSRDNSNTVKILREPKLYDSPNKDLLTNEEQMSQYHVVEWNGSPGLVEWGYKNDTDDKTKKCSMIEGAYDGTIFPRDMRQNRSVNLFRKAFCRPVAIEFIKDGFTEDGFRSRFYKMSDRMFDTPETAPENECFCYKNKCRKGLQNISPCYYGIPVVLSQPHFLNADPSILDEVNGMNPDREKHGSVCQIQPDLGVPLGGNMRIQINLGVEETKYNTKTKPFNGLTIPLFYLEITAGELPGMVVFLLTLVCKVAPVALEVLKYALGALGLALISGTAVLVLLNTRSTIPGGISLNTEYAPLPIQRISEQLQQYYLVNEKKNSIS